MPGWPQPSEPELLEVFRLGESVHDAEIVREAGDLLAWAWLDEWRPADARALTSRSLAVQTSAGSLTTAGLAADRSGDGLVALQFYEQALLIQRQEGDQIWQATSLNNVGQVYASRGEPDAAREYYD